MELTFGLELEWADVDKRIPIPEHCGSWDWNDYTIVNTDGHANDPTGATWVYGGEINTKPTSTIDEQVAIVTELKELLNPAVTYTNATHIHIAYEPLKNDIALLQKFFDYVLWQQDDFFRIAWRKSPLFGTPEQIKEAKKYMSIRDKIYVGKIPPNRVKEIRQAKTPQEFYEAHAPLSATTGKRVWHLSARAGINLKSLFKHGTVEFRCFAGSADPEAIRNAMLLCQQFFEAALGDETPVAEFVGAGKLPVLPPYDSYLEKRYQETKFKGTTNGRSRISN